MKGGLSISVGVGVGVGVVGIASRIRLVHGVASLAEERLQGDFYSQPTQGHRSGHQHRFLDP